VAPDNGFLVRGRIYSGIPDILRAKLPTTPDSCVHQACSNGFSMRRVGWAQTFADSRAASAVARIRCLCSGSFLRWRQACVRQSIWCANQGTRRGRLQGLATRLVSPRLANREGGTALSISVCTALLEPTGRPTPPNISTRSRPHSVPRIRSRSCVYSITPRPVQRSRTLLSSSASARG
jgi:hypothetical protein